MPSKLYNRARMTVTSTGTGALSLGTAVAGYQTFSSAGAQNLDTVSYTIEDGVNWEIGTGTYNSVAGTLSRTVTQSYNGTTYGTSAISVTTSAQVFITALAADLQAGSSAGNLIQLDASSRLPAVDASQLTTINASNISSGTLAVARGGSGATATTGTGNNVLATSPVLATPAIIGSSTGKTTISSDNSSASDYTLTLPAKTGNIITSADSGTVTQAMLASNVAGNGPAFYAYQSSAQTLSAGTFTKLSLQSEIFDTNNCFDSTTNYRFTPNVAGYYQITGGSLYISASSTESLLVVYKNGTNYCYIQDIIGSATRGVYGSALVYLNGSTDYIELYHYIGSGGTLTAGQNYVYMMGAMVRAA